MPMLWIHIKGMCHTSALPWHPQDGITTLILLFFSFFSFEYVSVFVHICASVCVSTDVKIKVALICAYVSTYVSQECVCASVQVFRIGDRVVRQSRQRGHCLWRECESFP